MSESAYHQGLRERLVNAIPYSLELGVQVNSVEPDSIEVMLPFREDWIGDSVHGLIHPGITSSFVDGAFGLAVLAKLGKLRTIATLDLRMDYLRPALRDQALFCRAECFRVTSHIAFARATVWQSDISNPVAISQATMMLGTTKKSVFAEASA